MTNQQLGALRPDQTIIYRNGQPICGTPRPNPPIPKLYQSNSGNSIGPGPPLSPLSTLAMPFVFRDAELTLDFLVVGGGECSLSSYP